MKTRTSRWSMPYSMHALRVIGAFAIASLTASCSKEETGVATKTWSTTAPMSMDNYPEAQIAWKDRNGLIDISYVAIEDGGSVRKRISAIQAERSTGYMGAPLHISLKGHAKIGDSITLHAEATGYRDSKGNTFVVHSIIAMPIFPAPAKLEPKEALSSVR